MRGGTLIVQTGDMAEAVDRFDAGAGETFRDQRHSVDFVRDRARREPITVISIAREPYDRILSPGLRGIGWPAKVFHAYASGRRMIDISHPSRIVARLPHSGLLAAACDDCIPTFGSFADPVLPVRPQELFSRSGLRLLRRNARLRRSLRHRCIVAVANHGVAAVRSLHDVLGVPLDKLMMHDLNPIEVEPVRANDAPPREGLVFVGAVKEAKGVGDLIRALPLIPGPPPKLTIIGDGQDRDALAAEAERISAPGSVVFAGRLDGPDVLDAMRAALAVVVLSRRSYGEGMPNVLSEALSVRTPLIVSDHPAFADRFVPGRDAVVFRAGNTDDLAQAIARLRDDPALAARLSDNSENVAAKLRVGEPMMELIGEFIEDDGNGSDWVQRRGLHGRAGAFPKGRRRRSG